MNMRSNEPVVPMTVPRQHACPRCSSHGMLLCTEIYNRHCDLCKAHSDQFLLTCGKCDYDLCDFCYGLLYWLPMIEKLSQPVSQEAAAELTQRFFMGKKDLRAIISAGLEYSCELKDESKVRVLLKMISQDENSSEKLLNLRKGVLGTWRGAGFADVMLRRAVTNNDLCMIKLLVDAGVNIMRGYSESTFQLAAEVGNIESIQVLLSKYKEGPANPLGGKSGDPVIAGLASAARAGNVACAYAIWKHASCNNKQNGVDTMVVGFIRAGLESEAESLILFNNSIDHALGLAGLPTGNPMANNCEAIKQAAVHGMWSLIDVMLASKLVKFEHVLTTRNAVFVGACEGGHVTQVVECLKSEYMDGFDIVEAFKAAVTHAHEGVVKLLLGNKQCGLALAASTEAVGVTRDLGVARVLSESASVNRATHVKQYNLACTLGSLQLVMVVLKSNKLEPSDAANGVILLVGSDQSTDTPVPALAYILSHPLYKQHAAVSPIQEEVLKCAIPKAPLSVVQYLLNDHTFDIEYLPTLRRMSLQNDDAGVAWCLLQALPEEQRGNIELEAVLAHAIDRMDFALIAQLLGSKDGQDANVPDLNNRKNNNTNFPAPVCDSRFAFENAILKRKDKLVEMLLRLESVDPSKDDNAAFRCAIRQERWNCAMVLINDNRVNAGANNNEAITCLSKASEYIKADDMEIVENLLKLMLNDEKVDVVVGMHELIKADCVFAVKLFGMCMGCPRVDLWTAVGALEEALVWSGNASYVYCIMNHSRAVNCRGVGKVSSGTSAQFGKEGEPKQEQERGVDGQEEERMLKKQRLQQEQAQKTTCIKDVCLNIFQRMKEVDATANEHAISAAREYCVWVLGDAVDSDDEESDEEDESNEMASIGGPGDAAATVEGQETRDDKEKVEKLTQEAKINEITGSKVRGGHPAMFPDEQWPYHGKGRQVRCLLLFQINLSDAPKLIQEHVGHCDGLYQVFNALVSGDSCTFVRHIPVSDFGVLVRGECPFDIHRTPRRGHGRHGEYFDYSERAIVGWVVEKDYPARCCSLICSKESEKDARFGSAAMNNLVAKKWNAWSVVNTFGDKFGGYYWHGNSGYTENCLGGEVVDSDEDDEDEPKLGVFTMDDSVKGKHTSIFHKFGGVSENVLRLVGDRFMDGY